MSGLIPLLRGLRVVARGEMLNGMLLLGRAWVSRRRRAVEGGVSEGWCISTTANRMNAHARVRGVGGEMPSVFLELRMHARSLQAPAVKLGEVTVIPGEAPRRLGHRTQSGFRKALGQWKNGSCGDRLSTWYRGWNW